MITVDVTDPKTGQSKKQELPPLDSAGECTFSLQVPGGVHFLVIRMEEDGRPLLCAEVEAVPGERVPIHLISSDGRFRLNSGARKVFYLPPHFTPRQREISTGSKTAADLVILVDATMISTVESGSDEAVALLAIDRWKQEAVRLFSFAAEVANSVQDLRVSLIAFGDFPLTATALPSYLIYPPNVNDRRLVTYHSSELSSRLAALRPSEGFDFVDALAEALFEVRQAGWREHARKLLLVIGDSPGYSMLALTTPQREAAETTDQAALAQLLRMADARVREHDVFEEAAALTEIGVEIATVFNLAGEVPLTKTPSGEILFAYARRQYQQLALFPDWSWTTETWDPILFAAKWLSSRAQLGANSARGLGLEPPTEDHPGVTRHPS